MFRCRQAEGRKSPGFRTAPFGRPFPTASAPIPAASAVLAAPVRFGSLFRQPRPAFGRLFRQPPLHSGSLSCFGSPRPVLAARLDRFVSRRTAFGSRWQALAGSARRNNPQDNTSKSAPSRCAAPIGAQRQSARRPCPWRPAGRRGSCRRPWRRRAGRHRRPASNGPLRGPRHRH